MTTAQLENPTTATTATFNPEELNILRLPGGCYIYTDFYSESELAVYRKMAINN